MFGRSKALLARAHSKGLIHFDTIRRTGSIRRAAQLLHVSPSALNRQLLELESRVGYPLFERLSRGLRLTSAGEILARHAITVLQDEERMSAELDGLRGLRTGHVDLVTVESLTHNLVPSMLARMTACHPGISASVSIAGSSKAAEAVVDGTADVAISFVSSHHDGLRQLAAFPFSLGAAVRPDHPLAASGIVTFAQCAQYPLVLPAPEISISEAIQPLLDSFQGPLQILLQTNSFELMKRAAEQGRGVVFVNRLGIEEPLERGTLVHLPVRDVKASVLSIHVRRGRSLTPALERFCTFAEEEIRQRHEKEIKTS